MVRIRNQIGRGGSKSGVPQNRQPAQPVVRANGGPAYQMANGRKLTNASIIYGIGAILIYILAFYNLASANWFNGIVLLIPSTSLAYLAYRYIQ